jgi:hypothetical protein
VSGSLVRLAFRATLAFEILGLRRLPAWRTVGCWFCRFTTIKRFAHQVATGNSWHFLAQICGLLSTALADDRQLDADIQIQVERAAFPLSL